MYTVYEITLNYRQKLT